MWPKPCSTARPDREPPGIGFETRGRKLRRENFFAPTGVIWDDAEADPGMFRRPGDARRVWAAVPADFLGMLGEP